jgi:Spy/CpxP family protein refolding chaperone
MNRFSRLLSAVILIGSLGASAMISTAAADETASPPLPPAAGGPPGAHEGHERMPGHGAARGPHWSGGHRGPLEHLLHKLNLSEDQKSQVKAIFEKSKPDTEALEGKERSTHESLAELSPKDPAFAALVATAKTNAAARVQLYVDLWTKIYGVLTPAQQARIPAIVAEEKSAHAAREAEWKAHHAAHDEAH